MILRPATVYGPGSIDVVGEIARAIRGRTMLLIDGGRAVAGLCYVENLMDAALLALGHAAAPGQAFNVTDGLEVTWREFTDGLAEGLGCPGVRWSIPYPIASAVGFSLEQGYRLARRTHRSERPAAAFPAGGSGVGPRPALQQSQGPGAARVGAAGPLRSRAGGDGRVVDRRGPRAPLAPRAYRPPLDSLP